MALRKAYHEKAKHKPTHIDAVVCRALSGALIQEDIFYSDIATGYVCKLLPEGEVNSKEDVAAYLRGKRVVWTEDVYLNFGRNTLRYLVEKKYVRRSEHDRETFWITKAGADYYGLPKVMNRDFK